MSFAVGYVRKMSHSASKSDPPPGRAKEWGAMEGRHLETSGRNSPTRATKKEGAGQFHADVHPLVERVGFAEDAGDAGGGGGAGGEAGGKLGGEGAADEADGAAGGGENVNPGQPGAE